MAPKVRDRIINVLLQTSSGIAIALFMYFFYAKDASAKESREALDKKADKTELHELKITNEKAHAEIRTEIKSEFNKDLTDLETRLNRQSDIRDKNLREFIKAVVE